MLIYVCLCLFKYIQLIFFCLCSFVFVYFHFCSFMFVNCSFSLKMNKHKRTRICPIS
ncbi:hypothetical protein HanIR_Chr07g0334901 [Helianthus annuus]|nr:hypothetical protein HanIR_Chr07g0334901 [Helianthus annuus]